MHCIITLLPKDDTTYAKVFRNQDVKFHLKLNSQFRNKKRPSKERASPSAEKSTPLGWDPIRDRFLFKIIFNPQKRYPPSGWISPFSKGGPY